MNQKQTMAPAAGLKLTDIYYILFRHKWMILGLTALSVTAAVITFAYMQMPYTSGAKIYISSVANSTAPGVIKGDETSLNSSANTILNSEVVFLQSLDLARTTLDTVPPQKILGTVVAGPTSTNDATMLIHQNFQAYVLPQTTVVQLEYTSSDPSVVTNVLDAMIRNYQARHKEIHEHLHSYDATLQEETDKRRNRLNALAQELAELKSSNNVVDIKEEMNAFARSEGSVKDDIVKAKAELAFWEATEKELEKQVAGANRSSAPKTTNGLASATNMAVPTQSEIDEYSRLVKRLDSLRDQDDTYELKEHYSTNIPFVADGLNQIAKFQGIKDQMEATNPGLLHTIPAPSGKETALSGTPNVEAEWQQTRVKIESLKMRINFENDQLKNLEANGANLNQIDDKIDTLKREEAMADEEYRDIYTEKAKEGLEETFRDLGNANIQIAEMPTPPVRNVKKVSKMMLGIGSSGLILGLVLSFVWELVLDRTFRRPQEVITRLKLPYFLTIPRLKTKGPGRSGFFNSSQGPKMLPAAAGEAVASAGNEESTAVAQAQNGAIAPWDERHEMRPFHETLRDRLVSYFDMINLTHKPKLVAVTSCGHGAGVSTVASGVASSLSETGEGNVLLVDMNSENGEAHHFYKGQLAMGLDEILEKQKENRASALVQDNLYVVKEPTNGDKLPSVLPKRFSHLVTKLKASDYDYIILDMPPVTEISVTPRLAKYMDMVLLVVESEKTNQDAAQRAAALLTESRANVGVVMNKCKSYIPQRLCHDGLLESGLNNGATV